MAMKIDYTRWPLPKFYEEVVKPKRGKSLSKNTLWCYGQAARLFGEAMGDKLQIRAITPEVMEQFIEFLETRFTKPERVQRLAGYLSNIVSHAYPDRPWGGRSEPKYQRQESNSDRDLFRVMMDVYLPANTRATAESTKRHYVATICQFSEYLGRPATLDDLTDETVGKFIKSMVDRGCKVATAQQRLNYLKATWNWLAKKRYVDVFPTIANLKMPRTIPTAWTEAEMRRLYDAASKLEGHFRADHELKIPLSTWFQCFVSTAFDTGERTWALIATKWEWINHDTGVLVIPAEYRKGRTKPMIYALRPATMELLESFREPTREHVFHYPYRTVDPFYRKYDKLLKAAGLPTSRHNKPQKIRRTFASYIEKAGGDATEALAHSSRSITRKSYIDPRIVDAPSPNKLLFDLQGDNNTEAQQ